MSDNSSSNWYGRGHGRPSSFSGALSAFPAVETSANVYTSADAEGFDSNTNIDDLPDVGGRAGQDINHDIAGSRAATMYHHRALDINAAINFRDYATGQPRYAFLSSSVLPRAPATYRRSTLADIPELDYMLTALKVTVGRIQYLPITSRVCQVLVPFINGAKPVADLGIFKNLLIPADALELYGDQVRSTLDGIGGHCSRLFVPGEPLVSQWMELHNKWGHVIAKLPHVKDVRFKEAAN